MIYNVDSESRSKYPARFGGGATFSTAWKVVLLILVAAFVYFLNRRFSAHDRAKRQEQTRTAAEDLVALLDRQAVEAAKRGCIRVAEQLIEGKSAEANELREFLVGVNRFHTGAEPLSVEHLGLVWAGCLTYASEKPDEEFSKVFTALYSAWLATKSNNKTNS